MRHYCSIGEFCPGNSSILVLRDFKYAILNALYLNEDFFKLVWFAYLEKMPKLINSGVSKYDF